MLRRKEKHLDWPHPSPPLPKGDPSGDRLHYVYHLICPVTHRVRYIGCTCSPDTRWRRHYGTRIQSTKEWIEGLVSRGLFPIMQIVSGPMPQDDAYADESRRITEATEQGWDGLLNRNQGMTVVAANRRASKVL